MKKALSVILACLMVALLLTPCLYAADAPEEACLGWGDMDGDGKATSGDARLVLRQSVNLENYPEEATRRCDIDKDNKITSADARFVLRLSVGLEKYPGHEILAVIGRDVTCTQDGMTDGAYCVICEKEMIPQETIPATGHKEVVDEAVAATCTEDGLTEGKHCENCGEVFVAQEVVPALGHDAVAVVATATDVCQEAQVCARCGEELSPELKHEYKAGSTVTPEKGIECTRCHKAAIPSFNELVNELKAQPHTYTTFSKSETEISDPKFTGIMLLLKSAFEDEFKETMGKETDYTPLSAETEVNEYTYEIIGSDVVSLLTDADVKSTSTENVTGVDFIKNLPDSYTATNNKTYDLTALKAKEIGDVLKVTVNVKPERYSDVKNQGGAVVVNKICSEYGDMISSAMNEFASMNEDFIKCDCDCLSTVTVTYYFERATLSPIAACYNITMDIDEKMTIDISGLGDDAGLSIPAALGKTGSISFDVGTNINNYFFFDDYIA